MKKSMISKVASVVLVAGSMALVGCGSGGGGSTPTQTGVSQSGTGMDGILVGATVCIDVNKNNVCDLKEPSDITDNNGDFNIAPTTETGPLVISGGTDKSTGKTFQGLLKAPAGSTVVTPLTSAIQALVEKGQSAEKAEASVKIALGIPTDVNVTHFDPYKEISGANATNAKTIFAKQTQLQVLVHSAAVTVASGDDSNQTDVNDTMSDVFSAITDSFENASAPVTLDAQTVTAAVKKAADVVYASNPAAKVAVKTIAPSIAEQAASTAQTASVNIEASATPADALDAAIALVNTSTQTAIEATTQAAVTKANDLNATQIANIGKLQDKQQAKEADALAAKQAQEEAQNALATAQAHSDADLASYQAYLDAQAAAAQAAAAQAAAEQAAADAAAQAAAQEKLIADEAAQRESEAQAAADAAAKEQALAEAQQAAADAAATAAAQETDLTAAQAAADAAEAVEQAAIAQAQVKADAQNGAYLVTTIENDVNATVAIQSDLNVTNNSSLDGNVSAVQGALSQAQGVLSSLVSLADSNSTDTNSSASMLSTIQTQADAAATVFANVQAIKTGIELQVAAQIALDAKIARITAIVTDINTTKNSAQTLFDVNGSALYDQINTDMSVIATIGMTYQDAADEYQTAAQEAEIALQAYNDANTSLATIVTAYSSAVTALNNVNETAADSAQTEADAAKAKMEADFATATTEAEKIATLRTTVEAIKDAADAAAQQAAGTAFFEGMTVGDIDVNENPNGTEYKAWSSTLNNGTMSDEEYDFNASTQTWGLSTNSNPDYILVDGHWSTDNGMSYTLNNDGTITLADGEQVKITQVVDLTADSSILADMLPSDLNVTFASGDTAYVVQSKYTKDQYRLWDVAKDWNTGSAFTNIPAYMNTHSWVGAYFDGNGNRIGIKIEDNNASQAIASDGTVVDTSSFTIGLSGNLVKDGTTAVVGSWNVIDLNTTSTQNLALRLTLTDPTITTDKLEWFDNFVAMNNNVVMTGKYIAQTTGYVTDSGDNLLFNVDAMNTLEDAIATYVQSQPAASGAIATALADKTFYTASFDENQTQASLETVAFSADGTTLNWDDGNGCTGTEAVSIDENAQTITFTNTSDSCSVGGGSVTFNIQGDLTANSGYVTLLNTSNANEDMRYYFNDADAQIYVNSLNSQPTAFTQDMLVNNSPLYFADRVFNGTSEESYSWGFVLYQGDLNESNGIYSIHFDDTNVSASGTYTISNGEVDFNNSQKMVMTNDVLLSDYNATASMIVEDANGSVLRERLVFGDIASRDSYLSDLQSNNNYVPTYGLYAQKVDNSISGTSGSWIWTTVDYDGSSFVDSNNTNDNSTDNLLIGSDNIIAVTNAAGDTNTTYVKYRREVNASDLNSTVFTNGGKAYEIAYIRTVDETDMWGDVVQDDNGTAFTDFTSMLTYYVDNNNTFSNDNLPQGQGYIFNAPNTTDYNGTVSIINYTNGSLVAQNAGYYDYNGTVLTVYKNSDNGDHDIFVVNNSQVERGDLMVAGSGGDDYLLDPTAAKSFADYFNAHKSEVDSKIAFYTDEFSGWQTTFNGLNPSDPTAIPATLYDVDVSQQ